MSNNGTSRFQFPGFEFRGNEDNSTHCVELGTIENGGAVFDLTMIRNVCFPDRPFVIANVAREGKTIWTFTSEGFNGVGLLAKAGEEVVIALCSKGKNSAVERVIPFATFGGQKKFDLRAIIAFKKAAADFLKKDMKLTDIEQKLVDLDEIHRREEEAAHRAEDAQARRAAHEERINAIRNRLPITVFPTTGGNKLSGIPVTDKEWPSLAPGSYAVLVDRIDEYGKAIGPREWFRVVKKGPGLAPNKEWTKLVTAQCSETAKVSAVKPVRTSFIDTKEGAFEVLLFGSKDDIRKSGLNSGTRVAVIAAVGEGVEVYTLHDGKMKSAGKHVLLA